MTAASCRSGARSRPSCAARTSGSDHAVVSAAASRRAVASSISGPTRPAAARSHLTVSTVWKIVLEKSNSTAPIGRGSALGIRVVSSKPAMSMAVSLTSMPARWWPAGS